VTATLTAPEGTIAWQETAALEPGLYDVPFPPAPAPAPEGVSPTPTEPEPPAEGRWSLTVSATDDQGLSSTTKQRFAVNSTLGSLGVAPLRVAVRKTGGRAEIRWSQARAARVKVTVETPEGILVRTVASASLPPGEQTAIWDGRRGSRKPVAGGRYVVRVTATNELGVVSLTQAITVRRVAG
jgi:hypothetical protein